MKRLEITNILVLVLGAICKSGAELIELNKVTDVSSPQFYCQADFPSVNNYTPLENSKLIFVQTVFRHGDRTPTYIAPGDTTDWNICNYKNYINEAQDAAKSGLGTRIKAYTQYSSTKQLNYTGIFWKGNCQRGQLSVKGANQLETLGSELRKIYVDKLQFLDSELKDANIKVRHTYVS
ncbi:Counting factor 60 [Zancudomyces culisetae]|uniref:Counting factor 60 n=1 Tax=Zancudomyces culisetae TaxID=1213189 RepID=A0A1R1PL77_ZANCU|nr:Counting factor 60 [Zancudomyces culisetae]|eukprot:OMH81716.1 Counting factor 60 [Zancudomyces culisetae]